MGKLVKVAKFVATSLAMLAGLALLGLSLPVDGRKALSVQTGSMEPSIKTGSLVFVKRVPAESIAVGDVITYINPLNRKQTITHRVEQISEASNGSKRFITKGDANYAADPPITQNLIVGKVSMIASYLGGARDFIFTWPGLILLVYLPALIIAIGEVRRLAAYYRSQHYALPEWLAGRRPAVSGHTGRNAVIVGLIGIFSLAVGVPAHALTSDQARMTGNTITVKRGKVLGERKWRCKKTWYGQRCDCKYRDHRGRMRHDIKRKVDKQHRRDYDHHHKNHWDHDDNNSRHRHGGRSYDD